MKKIAMVSFPLIAAALAVSEWAAHAATYNFYFNNTEQGDNSTATPNMTVTDDGKVFKTGMPVDTAKKDAAPSAVQAPALLAPASESSARLSAVAENPNPSVQHWRFSVGLSAMQEYGDSNNFSHEHPAEPGVSVSFFFNKYVGLTLFGAKLPTEDFMPNRWAFGLEAEVLPFHITVAGVENFLELGVIGGVLAEHQDNGDAVTQTFYNTSSTTTTTDTYNSEYWKYRAEGGLRMNLNFGRNWGIISSLRATSDYALVEGAVALRL